MKNDETSIAELWLSVKNYIAQKDRAAAAEHFLTAVSDNGVCDLENVGQEMIGLCSILDKALREYVIDEEVYSDYDNDEYEDY